MERPNRLTLETLVNYAPRVGDETANERIDRALAAMVKNIDDTRFPATAKRKIVITIESEPDDERRDVKTFVTVETKFPAERAAGAMVYLNTDAATGEQYATVGTSDKQGELPLTAPATPETTSDARPTLKAVGS